LFLNSKIGIANVAVLRHIHAGTGKINAGV
jgi:hypothetical protein